MARILSAVALLALALACGNGTVTVTAGGTTGAAPGLLSFGGASGPGAGPAAGSPAAPAAVRQAVTGQVTHGPQGPALAGVTVSLDPPAAPATTTDGEGSFSFPGVPAGTYQLSATLAGYAPSSQSLAVDGSLLPVNVALERSVPLWLAADAGDSLPWIAFAPGGGPLYASTATALWEIGDGGARAVCDDGTGVQPLGFGASGELIYLSDCGDAGFACRLSFGGSAALDGGPIQIFDGGPIVLGDSVFYASFPPGPFGPYTAWSDVSAASSRELDGVLVSPAPSPALDHSVVALEATYNELTPSLAMLSQDGGLVKLCSLEGWQSDSLAPLSAGAAAVVAAGAGTLCTPGQIVATFSASRVAPAPGGTALVSELGPSAQWLSRLLPDGGQSTPVSVPTTDWPPLLSPDGRYAVFAGAGVAADLIAGLPMNLPETGLFASFSPDGTALLLLDGFEVHVLSLGDGGLSDQTLEGTATSATFTPDGRSVVYGGADLLDDWGVFIQPVSPP